jgi:hypothetical protein
MLCKPSALTHGHPPNLRLVFGRDQPPSTWADMVQNEVAGTRAALDRLESIDADAVPHGPLLEVLVNCRTLSKTADRLCEQQEQVPRRRA